MFLFSEFPIRFLKFRHGLNKSDTMTYLKLIFSTYLKCITVVFSNWKSTRNCRDNDRIRNQHCTHAQQTKSVHLHENLTRKNCTHDKIVR